MAEPLLLPARAAELGEAAAFINRAYRGETATAGWSHEAALLAGARTDEAMLRDDLRRPGARLLLWWEGAALVGCVWLEPAGGDAWYLGALTVEPTAQAAGRGRRLLAAAEAAIVAAGGARARMTVIQLRDPLIAWYGRRGYHLTGETAPFPYGDERFGRPLRDDLRFVVLEKPLGPAAP